jgi:hypothetical protein
VATTPADSDGTAPRDTCCLFETACSRETFHTTLTHLSCNRAAGPDGVPNELLIILPTEAQDTILLTFRRGCYITGQTPSAWKRSNTTLLYKHGDPNKLSNYRPIGLLSTVYKVYSAMLTHAMSRYAETYGLLSST